MVSVKLQQNDVIEDNTATHCQIKVSY